MKRFLLALSPAFFIGSYWFFAVSNRENFPDPIAIHWGISGRADGFDSLDSHLTISIVTLSLVGLLWVALVYLGRIPRSVRILFLAITGVLWLVLFGIFNYTLVIQLGLQDASQAKIGIVFFLVLIAIPGLLVPWLMSKPKIALGERLTVSYWTIPLFRSGYHEIEHAGVSSVKASDFGGWGIRYANKTTAFLPASGLALELKLHSGERILIRTDNAAELAKEITHKRSGN